MIVEGSLLDKSDDPQNFFMQYLVVLKTKLPQNESNLERRSDR